MMYDDCDNAIIKLVNLNKMADILVLQGMTFHTILRQKLQQNIQRLHQIKKFSINTCSLFSQFSKNIYLTCKQLFQKLKIDEQQDQNIIFLSKFLIDILNQLTKKVDSIAHSIQGEIVEPMSEFVENQTLTNRMLLRQSQEIIYSLETNNQFLKELSKNFDINAKNNERFQQQEFNQIYEMEMEKCNEKWQLIKSRCNDVLSKIDSFNSSRCTFTAKQQINLIKMINKIVNNPSIEESLTDFEDMNVESTSLSHQIKDSIREKIGRVSLLEEQPFRIQLNHKSTQNHQNNGSKYSRQKKIIDDFVTIFTSKTNLKQESKNFEEARGLILDNEEWIRYFLTKMQSSLHTEINLPIIKYRQLTALIKYIFAHAAELQTDNEALLYSLLFISYRIRYGDDCLIKDIGRQEDFWKNTKIWFRIIEYVKKSKYSYKQVPSNPAQKPHAISQYIKFGKMMTKELWVIRSRNKQKNLKQLMQQQSDSKSQKILLDARDYDIMCEICYFMIKLQLQEKFVFNFILQASEKYHFSQEYIKKLVKIHSFNQISYNNKIGSTEAKRKKRLQKKYSSITNVEEKLCFCVGKALVFLSIEDDNIVDLRRVSKHWSEKLKKRVFQRYLIHENELNTKTRLTIYKEICRPPYSEEVYRRMVQEMPESNQHTQIIYLDAKRSLSWAENLRVNLMQVLGVYAFYHPDVGYLQGMNYLCENILKITTNTFEVYSIFQYLMENRYENMYTGKFDGLKIKIYQMMRILQRQNPNLYNHLQAQKIEGEHFLLSWAITLWGEMSGEICWILWDGFVVKGWKWWIKTCLWLLRNLQGEMLKMNFEQIMKCFSELANSLFCMKLSQLGSFGISKEKIKEEIDSIHIESDIMKDIEKEYEIKINTINQFLKKIDKMPK